MHNCHKIKAPSGKATNFAGRLGPQATKLCALLSGTPRPHSPLDVFGQFRALAPEAFGTSWVSFRAKYSVIQMTKLAPKFNPKTGRVEQREYPKQMGFRNLEELGRIAARYTDLADPAEIDLPEGLHHQIPVHLSPAARRVYDEIEENLSAQVGAGIITAQNGLVALLRLQQATGGTIPVEDPWTSLAAPTRIDTAKEDALVDLLEGLPENERVVVFCMFTADVAAARKAAERAGRRSLELSGQRHDVRGAWGPGAETVLVAQIQAGGLGIDLTSAAYCVLWSIGFNYGNYEQALKRTLRVGQTRTVHYYHLVAQDTVDEVTYKSAEKKGDLVADVVDWMKEAQKEEAGAV